MIIQADIEEGSIMAADQGEAGEMANAGRKAAENKISTKEDTGRRNICFSSIFLGIVSEFDLILS